MIEKYSNTPLHRRLIPVALSAVLAAPLILGGAAHAATSMTPRSLSAAIANAHPGQAIRLSAGLYDGSASLPTGVTLMGAGYGRTIIDAGGAPAGLTVKDAKNVQISGLTVQGAQSGILVDHSVNTSISRVRSSGSVTGIALSGSSGTRISNVISSDNHYGITLNGGVGNIVVNCTVVGNSGTGISTPSGKDDILFNNCIADSLSGIYIGPECSGIQLDHNVYYTTNVGTLAGSAACRTIADWTHRTGQEAHSVQFEVHFADQAASDFRPVNPVPWELTRAVTSDWGTPAFAGIKAPPTDIDGHRRVGLPDAGAYEVTLTAPRPPDGTLTIHRTDGVKSAGVFTPGGKEVAYLFQALPLPAGRYPFWLPTRDFEANPIPAGRYEVRSVESQLDWKLLGWVGDTGEAQPAWKTATVHPKDVVFAPDGHLLVGQDWSEDHTNVRSYDPATGKVTWGLYAGGDSQISMTIGSDGMLYIMGSDLNHGLAALTRVNPATGDVLPWNGGKSYNIPLRYVEAQLYQLASLAGVLYISHPDGIHVADLTTGVIKSEIADPGILLMAADPQKQVVWTVDKNAAGEEMKAFSPDGKLLATQPAPVADIADIAARDGRLALASHATGRVTIYDSSDLAALKLIQTVGTGDGPYGPIQADRFFFQKTADYPGYRTWITLGPDDELAVAEQHRVSLFDAQGKPMWMQFGVFGNAMVPVYQKPERIFNQGGRTLMRLDEKAGTWNLDSYWDTPYPRDPFFTVVLGAFGAGGALYGVLPGARGTPTVMTFTRFDPKTYKASPVMVIMSDGKTGGCYEQTDTNHDGVIDDKDDKTPLTGPGGTPLRGIYNPFNSYTYLRRNGDILAGGLDGSWLTRWLFIGIDAAGAPTYDWSHPVVIPYPALGVYSPYVNAMDKSNNGLNGTTAAALMPDGGYVINYWMQNKAMPPGGGSVLNNAGTDLLGIDKAGSVRWFHPLVPYHVTVEGMGLASKNIIVTGDGMTAEGLAVNPDGLSLQGFGQPGWMHYSGWWIDHPQQTFAWSDDSGNAFAMIGDNVNGRHIWWRVTDAEKKIQSYTEPLTLASRPATLLAALSAPTPLRVIRPAQPTIHIPHLRAPLPIDGSLAEWRTIQPQIVVGPDTAIGDIASPEEESAVVRIAYLGDSLYVQALSFNKVVNFDQPELSHFQQDGVEMAINGYFPSGTKFDITRTNDLGDSLIRTAWYVPDYPEPAALAPHSITVLPDAANVPERTLVEQIFGGSLANDKVIVYEFKLPINAQTYQGLDPKKLFPMEPGQTFWLGFGIDDNNRPGTNYQKMEVWPATFGVFIPKESGALAVLDK